MLGSKKARFWVLLFLIKSTIAYSQGTSITVEGTGAVSERPDVGYLNIRVETKAERFGDAISLLNSKTDSVYAILSELGIEDEKIRTSDFNIRQNYVFESNTQTKDGFLGIQSIQAEFPFSKEQLGNIINRFAEGETSVPFDFSFGLSDGKLKELKKELIKRAIQDATEKAELIAQSTGNVLGEMNEINYSKANPFASRVMLKEVVVGYGSSQGQSAGFEIKDIDLTDTILIKWQLE